MARTILVTGATGTVGSDVLRGLAGREGIQVRAAVRDKGKSAALAGPNIDLVWFDYNRPESLGPACRGVDAIFMVPPFTPDGVAQSLEFLKAAREAGAKHIVKLSVIPSIGGITVGKWHAAIDEALKKSGMAWTILRPGAFMQNFVETSAPRPDGNMYLPVGNSKTAFIDTRDIAAIAVKALTEAGHEGKEYPLTGPEALTMSEVAAKLSVATGRPIRYVNIAPEEARKAQLARGIPEYAADALAELFAERRKGKESQVSPVIEGIIGRRATSFDDFALRNAAIFRGEQPAPKV